MSIVAKRLDGSRWLLGMEVGLGSGHIVLNGNSAPAPQKRSQRPPIFGPFLLWQNGGWIKMPLGTEEGLGPGDNVLDGDPAPRPPKEGAHTPNFRPMSIVATVVHLSYC